MVMTEEAAVEATPKRRKRKEAEAPVTNSNGARQMSADHKAALARGREQGRAVRNYLEALGAHRPKRGRRRSVENMVARLQYIEDNFEAANALDRLHMAQERLDLEAELAAQDDTFDITEAEEAFIAVAYDYSASKGLTYDAWRAAGVQPSVLKAAGITRAG